MRRTNALRVVIAGIAALVFWGSAVPFAHAIAFDFYYNDANRFGLYGQQDNFTG